MLKQRILTAAILIPLVFIGIFYTSPLIFRFILAIVFMLAAWEWSNLIPLAQKSWRSSYILLLGIFFCISVFIPAGILIAVGSGWWLWVSYQIAITQRFNKPFAINNPVLIASIGIFTLTIAWVALSFLREQNQTWIIMLLLIIWLADTAAYFTGRRFGQHFLAPQISPKKTWEGALGALFAVLVMILASGWLMGLKTNLLIYLIVLSLATTLISIIGDLFESLLKRQAGIKDSGQLLPGHGGLLDRIDSLIAAAPFFAAGVFLLHWV